MYIEKITIENIKTYNKLEYNCNNNFNFIIGENNIGKTTIFDALLLWKMAYQELITKNGKKFYSKARWNSMNITFGKLLIFRLVNASNLLNNTEHSGFITLSINDGTTIHDLKIEINIPDIKDSYIRFRNQENIEHFNNFAKFCNDNSINLRRAISMDITKPISTILRDEPFVNRAQIQKKSYLGLSIEVLRNKILNTMVKDKFEYLESILKNVLGVEYKLIYKNINRDDEENIHILIQKEKEVPVDLYLVGSGILHILEIFASLNIKNLDPDKLNILLLDEPDSHIHVNLQIDVIKELRKINNAQIFVISHNDRFINQAKDGELFYLSNLSKKEGKLEAIDIDHKDSIQHELAGALDEFINITTDKPVIILEGKTDKIILETAWQKLYNTEMPFELISSGFDTDESKRTGSAQFVRQTIEYISTIHNSDKKIIGLFDNDREGNEQFNGLNKKLFQEYDKTKDYRKHKTKNIFGLRLPPPEDRSIFVTEDSLTQRYFVIEHYFKDEILNSNNIKGENILHTSVFEIKSKGKNDFANETINFNKEDFENFEILFEQINTILELEET